MLDKFSANSIANFGLASSFPIMTAPATYMVCTLCNYIIWELMVLHGLLSFPCLVQGSILEMPFQAAHKSNCVLSGGWMGPLVLALACKVRRTMGTHIMGIIHAALRWQAPLVAKTAVRWSLAIAFILASTEARVSLFPFGCRGFATMHNVLLGIRIRCQFIA